MSTKFQVKSPYIAPNSQVLWWGWFRLTGAQDDLGAYHDDLGDYHQDDGRAYHYSSFSGPVSGDVEKIAVQKSVYPYPYTSTYEQENDMTFDYVAKPDYSFVYGVEDPEFGKSHKHQETRDGDAVKGEYSVVEPDGYIRRVVYTSDAEHGFRATVTRTPPKRGWSLPPQPAPHVVTETHVADHVDEHEHVSYPDDSSTFAYDESSDRTDDYDRMTTDAGFSFSTPKSVGGRRHRY